MTVYHFEEIVVRVETNGDLSAAVGVVVNVTDPLTGLTPVGLTQGGGSVSFVTSGAGGILEFEAGVSVVHLNSPTTGFDRTVVALEQYGTGGSGVTDHGALTGLADDDHTQYAKVADAVPLASSTPVIPASTGFAGTAATAAHGDHRHPFGAGLFPTFLIPGASTTWLTTQADGTASTIPTGRMLIAPVLLVGGDGRPVTFVNAGVKVGGAGSGDSTAKIGLYPSLATGLPDWANLLFNVSVATATTGDKGAAVSSVVVQPGLYWEAVLALGTTGASIYRATTVGPRLWHKDTEGMNSPGTWYKDSLAALPTASVTLGTAFEPPAQFFFQIA